MRETRDYNFWLLEKLPVRYLKSKIEDLSRQPLNQCLFSISQNQHQRSSYFVGRIPLSRCRLRMDIIGSHKFSIIVRLPRLGSAREEDVVVDVALVVVVAGSDSILDRGSPCATGANYYLN